MFEDVGGTNGKERVKRRAVREEVGVVVSSVGERVGNVRILHSSEVSVPPKVVRDVRDGGVVEGEETRDRRGEVG